MKNQIELAFVVEDRNLRIIQNKQEVSVDWDACKSWCNPAEYFEIVGADFGKGSMHWYKLHAEESGKCSIDLAIDFILSLEPRTLFVCERAHLATPQTNKSLAQPFTEEQLLSLYRLAQQRGVAIKLFPHAHTRKAREWVTENAPKQFIDDGKKSDENDAKALAYYVRHCNQISLGNPPASFQPTDLCRYVMEVRRRSNIALNAARVRGYNGEVFKPIAEVAVDLLLTQTHAERESGINFVNEVVAFSISSLAVTELNGVGVRYTYKGKPLGANRWLNRVLGSSSTHHRGGVARSNIYWHRFRNYLVKYGERNGCCFKSQSFRRHATFNRQEHQVKSECMAKCRAELKAAYAFCLKRTADWPAFEVLDLKLS